LELDDHGGFVAQDPGVVGVGWHEHDARLFRGTERLFRPGYQANLVGSWLPALDDVTDKLTGAPPWPT